jgi:hypothetical protein
MFLSHFYNYLFSIILIATIYSMCQHYANCLAWMFLKILQLNDCCKTIWYVNYMIWWLYHIIYLHFADERTKATRGKQFAEGQASINEMRGPGCWPYEAWFLILRAYPPCCLVLRALSSLHWNQPMFVSLRARKWFRLSTSSSSPFSPNAGTLVVLQSPNTQHGKPVLPLVVSFGSEEHTLKIWSNIYIFETGSHDVVQAGLELTIFLLQPPECWDYRYVPPCLALSINFF